MTLRKWRYEDILKIADMEKEYFPYAPWSYRLLAESFESDNFYGVVAEDGGEIAGYGSITVNVDTADLENIVVAEPYRRCGTGSLMLEELTAAAAQKGCGKIFLEVKVSNSAALMLYLKHGFNGIYARKRYYTDGEDCLVMAKEL